MDGLCDREESMEELDATVGGPPSGNSLFWVSKVEPLPKSTIAVGVSSEGRQHGGEGGVLSSSGNESLLDPKLDLEDVLR